MILIFLDGISEIGVHMESLLLFDLLNAFNLAREQSENGIFLHECATFSELPSNINFIVQAESVAGP